jgi:multicomponent Na+:H+ antiporter subunit D
MTSPELPPAFLLLAGAALVALLPAASRRALCVATPALGLVWLLTLPSEASFIANWGGFPLEFLVVDGLSRVFGIIFLLVSAVAAIYAWHVDDRGQQVAALLYAAGAVGVTFAGDLVTLLIFWEVMAFASAWLIFARRTPESRRAAFRYLLFHILGGNLLLGGVVWLWVDTGNLTIAALAPSPAAWLILLGVILNAAAPPLHAWLPDSYPKATITGAIFMSALTTKSAVYALARLFPSWEILLWVGVFMTLFGVIYAILANDIRQILSYHIISQVGYMVAAVGIGTELALNGAAAHAYSHILYKALLFMGAGVVLHTTGRSKLSELGGLSRKMPVAFWLFMVGAVSISGFPLFNGFISKSIIVSAAGYSHHEGAVILLLLASVGTFLSIGIKIPAYAFWGKDAGISPRPAPRGMLIAMGILAGLCFFYGVVPDALYIILPYEMDYHPYTAYHFVEAVQILVATFIGFWILRGLMVSKPYIALDVDWFYRRGAPLAGRLFVTPVLAVFTAGAQARDAVASHMAEAALNPLQWWRLRSHGHQPYDENRDRQPVGRGLVYTLIFLLTLTALVWASV